MQLTEAVDEFEFFLDKQWSDGLPVVTPTEERVARMLKATKRDPDELIGRIPPMMEPATVRTVAIHALMAGCKPEYLPVVLGALPLMLREEFNMNGVQGTMHGVAPLMIVNGPYAQKIGIHGGNGCFGPGFRANASIGRAIRLMMMNLGGGIAGIASATIFATPMRYTACITENIERSPWESLAVSKGYAPDANVITCAMVESPKLCFDDVSQEPQRLLDRHRRRHDRHGLVEHARALGHGRRDGAAARRDLRERRDCRAAMCTANCRDGRAQSARSQRRRQLAARARAAIPDQSRSRRRRLLHPRNQGSAGPAAHRRRRLGPVHRDLPWLERRQPRSARSVRHLIH